MTLFSDAACNASLAMRYGPDKGSLAPTHLELALFSGDPRADGVEMDLVGGYAPAAFDNDGTAWPDAPTGRSITGAPVAFTPTGTPVADNLPPTDPWTASGSPASVTHFGLRDADTSDLWDVEPLTEEVTVLDSRDAFTVQPKVNYVPVVAVT